jgi:hypothetical protein
MDFDSASQEWRKNKINNGKGYFQYKCCNPECKNPIYLYTTQNIFFAKFANEFDILNQYNPNQYEFCENHLNK